MKTQISILALSLLTVMNVACSKNNGSSEVSSAAAVTPAVVAITVSASPSTVVAGGSTVLYASGGTAPYTFVLTSGSSGSLSSSTGNYTTYTAAASGTYATVMVTDANNNSVYYSVPLVASTTTTTTSTGACSGVFNADIAGSAGTMYIVADTSGNFAGSLAISGGTAALSGTCVSGNINFANQFSGSTYTGTYATNAGGKVIMTGSFTTTSGSVYMWSASQQ